QHLWPAIAERRRRVVLNRFGVTKDSPVEPFRMMCAPLHALGRLIGIVVAFNPRTSGRFVPPDAQRLERLGLSLTKLVARAFDNGTGVLTRLYATHASAAVSPDLPALWRALGVVAQENAEPRFDDSAPLAAIRRSLTAPAPAGVLSRP
ncbi:MAG TPA: hypothetical protein PKW88_01085, partial [Plasticicumulans sp.]|nr:hypothetical protein [Plasticicumulans sp.]